MGNIAIIPARGGSKRIPQKNLKDFLRKPIIAYSIEAALKSELFEEVMVSTDSAEIAEVAINYGAKVPFLRSFKNSDDFATTSDVLIEVIQEYLRIDRFYQKGCCIYATAPLITTKKLKDAHDLLIDKNYDSVFPVVKFSYPIQRALQLVNGKTEMINPEFLNTRSQDLPPCYHDCGQFYWFNIHAFTTKGKIFTDNSGAILISELEAQDIDEPSDWLLAEHKFKLLNTW